MIKKAPKHPVRDAVLLYLGGVTSLAMIAYAFKGLLAFL
jgi:hypothetical protein